jgi:hypothetical protein
MTMSKEPSDPAHIVLAKYIEVGGAPAIELRSVGTIPRCQLSMMTEVAQDEGFGLMYEFNSEPDEDILAERARTASISEMPNLVNLWVLEL